MVDPEFSRAAAVLLLSEEVAQLPYEIQAELRRELLRVEEFDDLGPDALAIWDALFADSDWKRFDPNQPRDPHTGEWTDAPGGGFHGTALDHFSVGPGTEELTSSAVQLLDQSIKVPVDLPRTKVTPNNRLSSVAAYDWAWDEIEVSKHAEVIDFVHEFGHRVDHGALRGVSAESELRARSAHETGQNPKLSEAIDQSESVKAGRALMKRGAMRWTKLGPRKPDKAYLRYAFAPGELFARAFEQWIVTRAGQEPSKPGIYHTYWEADDFRPIAQAMDDLFEEHGWLRS